MNKKELFKRIQEILPQGFSIADNPNRIIVPDNPEECEIVSRAIIDAPKLAYLDGTVLDMRFIHGKTFTNHFGADCPYLTEVHLGELTETDSYQEIVAAFENFAEEFEFWSKFEDETNDYSPVPS